MTDPSAFATWREIHSQPAIWRAWGSALDVPALRAHLDALGTDETWFCGAGSSAYLGEMLAAGMEGREGPRLRALATTDILARPAALLRGERRLILSFGRSGNSAETLGLLDALQALAPDWPRLNITCNRSSALGRDGGARVLVLPDATHDAGFAMTSSFTTMYLTALALFDRTLPAGAVPARFAALADALPPILDREGTGDLPLPDRVVFLGSGALAFAAREAALKVMELSAGAIPALWDSTLGFRHGPKSFVRGRTDIRILRSVDPRMRRYDDDLIGELKAQFPEAAVQASDVQVPDLSGRPGALLNDLWTAPLHVARAQVLAARWSAALGLNVDDPFAGQGTLTRVVQGVRLLAPGDAP